MSGPEAYANCRFYVDIGGVNQAVFTDVSGLQMETAVQEYEEGGNNGMVHRFPGRTKMGNLVLKRGMVGTNELLKWYLEIAAGRITRRHLSVIMYDTAGAALMKWHFTNAYPVKWVGPQFTAGTGAMAIETLELAHDGLTLE